MVILTVVERLETRAENQSFQSFPFRPSFFKHSTPPPPPWRLVHHTHLPVYTYRGVVMFTWRGGYRTVPNVKPVAFDSAPRA